MSEPWQWIIIALAFVSSIVAFRARISFDVNEWHKRRDEKLKSKLKSLCPHVEPIITNDGDYGIRTTYVSPAGTINWHCQRCGHTVYDESAVDENSEYWASHPKDLQARRKKVRKTAKKLGII